MNLIEATIQALTGNKIEEKANVANADINKKLLNPNENKAELQRAGYNVSKEDGFTSVKRADRVNDFRELAVFKDGEVLPVTDKNIADKTINKDVFDAKNFLDTDRKEDKPVMSKVNRFKMNKDTIAQADMEIADAEIEKEVNPEDAEILDTNVIKPWKKLKSKAQSENDRLLKREVTESYFEDELDFGENDKDIPEVEKQYKLKIKDITEPNAKHNSVYRLTGNKEDIVKFINDNYDEEDRAEVLKYVKECTKINESIEGTAHIMNKINNAMKEIASGNVKTNIYELTSEIEEEIARAEAEEDKSAVDVLTDKLHEINNAYSHIQAKEDDGMELGEAKELLVEDLDESFYEKICRAYIDTMNLEWVTTNPENFDSVVHGYFADDSEAEKWEYGAKVTPENFKDVAQDAEYYEYETWEDFYEEVVKDNILYDIKDIGLYGMNDEWDFYISEEDLEKLDLIEDEDDVKTEGKFTTPEQDKEFEEFLNGIKVGDKITITYTEDEDLGDWLDSQDTDIFIVSWIDYDSCTFGIEGCDYAINTYTQTDFKKFTESKKLNEDIEVTNAFDKTISIEDNNGDTLMSFKISSDGDIYGFENCEVADEEADSIRIQQVGSLGEYAGLAENKKLNEDEKYYDLHVTNVDKSTGYARMTAEGAGEMLTHEIDRVAKIEIDHNDKFTESKNTVSWEEIFKNAEGHTFGTRALKIKDQARAEVEDRMKKDGIDIDNLESVEDEIEKYVSDHNIKFTSKGNIVENKSIKLEDISMNGIVDYREIIDKDNGDLVDTFFFDHKLTADEDAKIKEAIENAKLEDDYDNYTVMEYINKIVPIKQTLSAIYSDLGASTNKQLYY